MKKYHGLFRDNRIPTVFRDKYFPNVEEAKVDTRVELETQFRVPFPWLCVSWPKPGSKLLLTRGGHSEVVTVGNGKTEITPLNAMRLIARS